MSDRSPRVSWLLRTPCPNPVRGLLPDVVLVTALMAILVVVLTTPVPSRASEAVSPASVVERLHRILAEHLRPPERTFQARLQRLEPVLASSFDFDAITRVALGSAFEAMDEPTRARFIDLMRRLSALTYADRFSTTDAVVRFVTLSEQAARRGRVLVRTRLERDSDEPVTLDYVLVNTPDGPRIVNVLANGVSDLSLKRAEYAAVIRTDGVAELERRLTEQVDRLAAQGADPVTVRATGS